MVPWCTFVENRPSKFTPPTPAQCTAFGDRLCDVQYSRQYSRQYRALQQESFDHSRLELSYHPAGNGCSFSSPTNNVRSMARSPESPLLNSALQYIRNAFSCFPGLWFCWLRKVVMFLYRLLASSDSHLTNPSDRPKSMHV